MPQEPVAAPSQKIIFESNEHDFFFLLLLFQALEFLKRSYKTYLNIISVLVKLVGRPHGWRHLCYSAVYQLRLAHKTYFGPQQMLRSKVLYETQ